LSSQGEGERVGFDKALFEHGLVHRDHAVHGDSGESHTQNTVEFGGQEGGALELSWLTEINVFGSHTSNSNNVIGNEAFDTSAAVLDFETGLVLLEGGRFLAVVGLVFPAGKGLALLAGYPEIGGSGIEDHFELLGRGSDGNFTKVLGIKDLSLEMLHWWCLLQGDWGSFPKR